MGNKRGVTQSPTTRTSITSKQRVAITALCNGFTRARAAKEAKVSDKTLYNWLADDRLFIRALERARDATFRSTTSHLTGALHGSILTLQEAQEQDSEVTSTQVRAANALLSHGKAYLELGHLAEKFDRVLVELEELRELYGARNATLPGIVIENEPLSVSAESEGSE